MKIHACYFGQLVCGMEGGQGENSLGCCPHKDGEGLLPEPALFPHMLQPQLPKTLFRKQAKLCLCGQWLLLGNSPHLATRVKVASAFLGC